VVNSVQPVTGKRVETSRIEPAQDRPALASQQVTGPAAPPAAAAPATVVQLSDAVYARQRGVAPGKGDKGGKPERRIATSDEARIEAARARATLLGDSAAAAAAHQPSAPDRVFALVFE
jgi:hypothetical protein